MPPTLPNQFEQQVIEMIDQSPVGAVPHTPAHQEALRHLLAMHQVYPSADYADGFVTVHALAALPSFWASNLEDVMTGRVEDTQVEPDSVVFDRYVASLPEGLRESAEARRKQVLGGRVHHRHHAGEAPVVDPLHTLFLVPGAGAGPGLPGNYLYGVMAAPPISEPAAAWTVQIHDRDGGAATRRVSDRAAAWDALQDVLASAPFLLSELVDLEFTLN